MLVEVAKDVVDDPGLGDEGDDLHRCPAFTMQRVDLVHTADALRPGPVLSTLGRWIAAGGLVGCPVGAGDLRIGRGVATVLERPTVAAAGGPSPDGVLAAGANDLCPWLDYVHQKMVPGT